MIHTDSDEGPVPVEVLQFQAAKAKDADLAAARRDMEAAAGELLIDVPEPGTDMARLLSANVLMRRERDALRAALHFYAHAGYSDVADDDGRRACEALEKANG